MKFLDLVKSICKQKNIVFGESHIEWTFVTRKQRAWLQDLYRREFKESIYNTEGHSFSGLWEGGYVSVSMHPVHNGCAKLAFRIHSLDPALKD